MHPGVPTPPRKMMNKKLIVEYALVLLTINLWFFTRGLEEFANVYLCSIFTNLSVLFCGFTDLRLGHLYVTQSEKSSKLWWLAHIRAENGLWLWFIPVPVLCQAGHQSYALLVSGWSFLLIGLLANVRLTPSRPFALITIFCTFTASLFLTRYAWQSILPLSSTATNQQWGFETMGQTAGFAIGFAIFSIVTVLVPYVVSYLLLWSAHGSFAIGEAGVVALSISLYFLKIIVSGGLRSSSNNNRGVVRGAPKMTFDPVIVSVMEAASLATLYLVLSTTFVRRCRRSSQLCYVNIFLAIFGAVLYSNYASDTSSVILYGLEYLFDGGKTRIALLLFWFLCLDASVVFVSISIANKEDKITSIHRKFFHLTVGLVCWSGLVYDPELTLLASVVIGALFVIIEIIRLVRLPPFGDLLNNSLGRFADKQDAGPLLLTPIYLLISMFVPLWISPISNAYELSLKHMAGILSVGFGDSFASICGILFGKDTRFRWNWNKEKSLQGTIGGLLAQVLFLTCLCPVPVPWSFPYTLFICSIVALLETFSSTIDNLSLPLITYLLLA